MPWYTAALKPITDKISPAERKLAEQFLEAYFNVLIEARANPIDTSENDSNPDPGANLDDNVDEAIGLGLQVDKKLKLQLELEFYFGVIEKVYTKFADQKIIFLEEFARYLLGIMPAYTKVAEDEIDFVNIDAIEVASEQKLFNILPNPLILSSLPITLLEGKIDEDLCISDLPLKLIIYFEDALEKAREELPDRNELISELPDEYKDWLKSQPQDLFLLSVPLTTEEGEVINKNLRLSDFPLKVIKDLEKELKNIGEKPLKRNTRLSKLPIEYINWLESQLIKKLIKESEREVLKDLRFKMNVNPWQVISLLVNSEAKIPQEVAKYLIALFNRNEEKSSKEEAFLDELSGIRKEDEELDKIIAQADEEPIIENLTKVIWHCIEQSIKDDRKSSPPPFFQRESVPRKVRAAENLVNALQGEYSLSKADKEVLKKDIGLMGALGKLLKDRDYRERLEDALGTQALMRLNKVSKLFNYLALLSEPADLPEARKKLL